MLLAEKNAIIYGGAGRIGRAVAHAFAREGARVHLTGRTPRTLDEVADEIRAAGGSAEAAQIDALDEEQVDAHADAVAASAGSIDISFNLIGLGEIHTTPLAEMSLVNFEQPVGTATRTLFLTARAAARHMIRQGSGVILTFGGAGDPYLGGFQVALGAVDVLRRQLAVELGPYGIRVVTLRSGGVPETVPDDLGGPDAIVRGLVDATALKRAATSADVGNVAVFAASDAARTITASAINMTCGAMVD